MKPEYEVFVLPLICSSTPRDAYGIYVVERRGIESAFLGQNGEWSIMAEGGPLPGPTLTLGGIGAKEIMRAIAKAITEFGIKPAGVSFVEGKLAGVEAHLADMRALVFKRK